MVLVNENIYGSNWQNNANGEWVSVNWETGKTNWETKWENKGSTVSADNMLYMYEEKRGNMALVKANPEKFDLISSFQVKQGAGPHWARPAIYFGKLLVRHGDVLLAYNIAKNK